MNLDLLENIRKKHYDTFLWLIYTFKLYCVYKEKYFGT